MQGMDELILSSQHSPGTGNPIIPVVQVRRLRKVTHLHTWELMEAGS